MKGLVSMLWMGLVFLLAACGGQPAAEIDLRDTQWQLQDIAGQPVPPGLRAPTARFQSDGKLQGTTGCNSYFTGYQAAKGALTLQMIARTEMACAPSGQMELEDRFIKALAKARAYAALNQQLQLKSADGEVLMSFTRLPAGN